MTTMYVIMGNDCPGGICSTEGKANAVVEAKKAAQQEEKKRQGGNMRTIYWRATPFEVDALVEKKEG